METWLVVVIILLALAVLFAACACVMRSRDRGRREFERVESYAAEPPPMPPSKGEVAELDNKSKEVVAEPVLTLPLTFPLSGYGKGGADAKEVDEAGYYLRRPDIPLVDDNGNVASLRERFPMTYEARPDLVTSFSDNPTGKQLDIPYSPGRYSMPPLRMFPEGVKGGPMPHVLPPPPPDWEPRLKYLPKLDSKASALVPESQVTGTVMRGVPIKTKELMMVTRGRGDPKTSLAAPNPYTHTYNPDRRYITRHLLGSLADSDDDNDEDAWKRPKSGRHLGRPAPEFAVPTAEWQRERMKPSGNTEEVPPRQHEEEEDS